MQTELIAIICGLSAGIGWGFSGFFDAKASKAIGPLAASFLINGIVAVGYGAVYFLFLSHSYMVDAAGIWYGVASGVAITIGALSYFKGLSLGPVSLVSPLSAAYPLVTTIIALAVFGAHPTVMQFGAICMIMIGVMAASGLLNLKGINVKKLEHGPILAIFTAISWGAGYATRAWPDTGDFYGNKLGCWLCAGVPGYCASGVGIGVVC